MLKICYIAHPISGDVQANLTDLRRIVRLINLTRPDVVPFVPYFADCVSMRDDVESERERGIQNDTAILESGIVQELWLTGDRISNGMREEIILAAIHGIPVVNKMLQFADRGAVYEQDDEPFPDEPVPVGNHDTEEDLPF